MIDPRLQADIQMAESCRLTAYRDSRGLWTIGWGHLLTPQPSGDPGLIWTQDQADAQLAGDIDQARAFAATLREWPALDTDARRNAVTELVFNMGNHWLLFNNTRGALVRQDWKAAHDGLLSSLWASQVHSTRAGRIADYILTGAYPS